MLDPTFTAFAPLAVAVIGGGCIGFALGTARMAWKAEYLAGRVDTLTRLADRLQQRLTTLDDAEYRRAVQRREAGKKGRAAQIAAAAERKAEAAKA